MKRMFLFAVLLTAVLVHQSARADTELKPVAEFKLNVGVGRFMPSPDGKYVYFLNKSEGKIQRIDVAKKELDTKEVDLAEGAEFATMSPDGKMIYVSASPKGHNISVGLDKQVGKVQVIDPGKMAVTTTYDIKFDPFEAVAGDDGKVYLSPGSGQEGKMMVVDTKKKGVMTEFGGVYRGSNMRMTPDGKRIYISTNGLSPGSSG